MFTEEIRYKYNLYPNSIVFDVGGYEGEFSKLIYEKVGCYIYIFEPIYNSFKNIKELFKKEEKVKVFHYGLSNRNEETKLFNTGSSTSLFKNNDEGEKIIIKDIYDVLQELNINKIDLIKINIEGEEYNMLKRMIEKNIHNKCKNIQIQFHYFVEKSKESREEIRKELSKTHLLMWDYQFVWESWEKK